MWGPKTEALSDDHSSKTGCSRDLLQLYDSIGNLAERKRHPTHALQLRKQGDISTRLLWYWPTYPTRIGGRGSSRRRCNRLGKLDSTADRAETLTDLAYYCTVTVSPTPQRESRPPRSNSFGHVVASAFLATYLTPRAGRRRPVTISR